MELMDWQHMRIDSRRSTGVGRRCYVSTVESYVWLRACLYIISKPSTSPIANAACLSHPMRMPLPNQDQVHNEEAAMM